MCALLLELRGHQVAPLLREVPVPGRRDRDAGGEHGDIVCLSNGQGPVLQTQTFEAETRDRSDVTDARSWRAGDELGLLLECELGDEVGGALEGGFPVLACGVGCCGIVVSYITTLGIVLGEEDTRDG